MAQLYLRSFVINLRHGRRCVSDYWSGVSTVRLPLQPVSSRTISRALQWHYSDAPGGGAEMARGGAPPAPAPLLQIAAGAGYSGRGRRPAAATPSARLFSEYHL